MKVLLDTNFIRHLSLVNQISLLDVVATNLGWEFIIPQKVKDELSDKGIPNQLLGFLTDNSIKTECCTDHEISLMPSMILSLDDGELEAICIINKCEDRQFKDYLFLTDDKPAQKKAGRFCISSLDITAFLYHASQKNLLDKNLAISSLDTLEGNGYEIEKAIRNDFIKNLR